MEGSSKLMKFEEQKFDDERPSRYTIEFEVKVKLSLNDGTTIVKKGLGKSTFIPSKNAAFIKSQKEACTDGLKRCFYGLIELLIDYEEKVKSGFFDKYI
ncbi:hypothetical protein FOA43_003847 [Brettanomyces nanus]|uniref:Uncharacterized protein n=1 Tax=Eeniella nana TaxID=13502 RepID=A0A875S689_EENNA|nr:uncharacterized protein FOA43_003847 [Brettanomyces nanus]QPG76458.1 hypothetical protein FOA43_003847 [Brettanomyces nanus]